MSTTQGGKDYEMIGYNFDQLILRTHKDGRDHDIRIQPKDKSLDLDVFHSCKPNSKTNVVTTTIIAHDLTARQVEAIRNFLYKPNKL
ncbi:hypothetical protein [Wolbachia endosymbiont of Ctenocephalides felis wCfeT]|uniref:hypothetical protein n=1 Tax=Wolbachia endosymbiont of Ctenocephalides felis wCfeT TaxID=2732593 RepID=UPI001444E311|nr:hypothetical protein [Wolbachia endosymbiont of Ctenocephalides felis wCfeT]